jgi:AcrR family transcriptional regulator
VEPRRTSVREQRKRRTRGALLQAADDLFSDRGYENVTVAEIAAAAGVSVKTVFQHFRSKGDLLFQDDGIVLQRLLLALRQRRPEEGPLEATTQWLLGEVGSHGRVERFHRMFREGSDSPVLAVRQRRLWEDYENAIAGALADEANQARATPRTRLVAAQLVAIIRVGTSREVRQFVARHPSGDPSTALREWILEASEIVGRGLLGDA